MSGYASVSSYGAVPAEAEVLFDGSKPVFYNSNNNNNKQTQKQLLIPTSSASNPNNYIDPPQSKFRDVSFGVAFILHLGVFFYVYHHAAITTGSHLNNDEAGIDANALNIWFGLMLGLTAAALSIGQMRIIRLNALFLVHVCLTGYVAISLVAAIFMVFSGQLWITLLGIMQFIGVAWYFKVVWPYAPFSAANLLTAVTAVLDNAGLSIVGIAVSALSIVWTYAWLVVVSAVQNISCDDDNEDTGTENSNDICGGISYFYYFLMFCSLFWTILVLNYTTQCTVAGVVGTWWNYPSEAHSCCSNAIGDSLFRSLTYSFGSICKGALVLAVVKALRAVADQVREEERRSGERDLVGSLLLCVITCLLDILEEIIEYANQWVSIIYIMRHF